MKSLHISILACCIVWHSASAFYTVEQLEQIEQKYESPEDQDFFNPTNSDQASAIETLNQAYSQLEPSHVSQGYGGDSAGGIPKSLLSSPISYGSSSSSSASLGSPSDSGFKTLEGKSSEYSKVMHIPSGSLFSMPDKGHGPLEFESPFSKQPYSIVFRTHSMPVKIKQQHQTLPAPEVEYVKSQEEAHRIRHEVVRPVIQEVREIIQPYRKVIQEVRPVQESIHTVISKGDSRGKQTGDGGHGQAVGGGFGGGANHGSGRGGHGNAGFGGNANGGLNVGYSEHLPRFAHPQQQQHHFRAPVAAVNPGPVQHHQQYSMPQFSALSRGPSPHSRY